MDLENAYTQDVFRLGDSGLESPQKPVGVKDPVSQVSTLLRQLRPREQAVGDVLSPTIGIQPMILVLIEKTWMFRGQLTTREV